MNKPCKEKMPPDLFIELIFATSSPPIKIHYAVDFGVWFLGEGQGVVNCFFLGTDDCCLVYKCLSFCHPLGYFFTHTQLSR